MLKICPACDSTTGLEIIERPEEFEIKGEKITILARLYHCKECDRSFSNKELGDPFKTAYDEYRRLKGMVQPEQIVQFRKKYDLSQKELSDLLGFGAVTLSRYENGSLQDEAHDNILKLAMEPQNLLQLVQQRSSKIPERKYKSLLAKLNNDLFIQSCVEMTVSQGKPAEYTGGVKFSVEKVSHVIEFLCFNRKVFKTKLMKLLFYSDFIHYKNHGVSITGLSYAHLPHGPVPDDYELILGAILRNHQNIHLDPIEFPNYSGEVIRIDGLKYGGLSELELETLRNVSTKFEHYSSKELSDLSHLESAYRGTDQCELISYKYALTMNLD